MKVYAITELVLNHEQEPIRRVLAIHRKKSEANDAASNLRAMEQEYKETIPGYPAATIVVTEYQVK